MTYDKSRVGLRIKSLRVDKGYDQKRLSEESKVPISTLQSYEDGTSVMGMENALKLANALGCSLDRLACRADDDTERNPQFFVDQKEEVNG